MEEIYKCECGRYLKVDQLEYVMDYPQTQFEPEEGHSACPICGRDFEDMNELDTQEILDILNGEDEA